MGQGLSWPCSGSQPSLGSTWHLSTWAMNRWVSSRRVTTLLPISPSSLEASNLSLPETFAFIRFDLDPLMTFESAGGPCFNVWMASDTLGSSILGTRAQHLKFHVGPSIYRLLCKGEENTQMLTKEKSACSSKSCKDVKQFSKRQKESNNFSE